MQNVRVIQASKFLDNRGSLHVIEYEKELPFVVKRVYYVNAKTNCLRGQHAHLRLKQLMFCVGGSCKLYLDNGRESTTIVLDAPEKCVIIEPCVWREMYDFSDNATLIVLASETYDETDYVRDYESFNRITKGIE